MRMNPLQGLNFSPHKRRVFCNVNWNSSEAIALQGLNFSPHKRRVFCNVNWNSSEAIPRSLRCSYNYIAVHELVTCASQHTETFHAAFDVVTNTLRYTSW